MDFLELLKNYYWKNRISATTINYIRNYKKTELDTFKGLYLDKKSKYFTSNNDPFKFKSKIVDNNFYSIYSILETLNYDTNLVYAEHGLFLGNYFQGKLKNSWIKEVVTFSSFRKKIIESNGLIANPIGPYIHYVDSYATKIVEEDYILVILKHSGTNQNMTTNQIFEEHILDIQRNYGKKVILQLHPNDISLTKNFSSEVFWTSCGFKRDPDFLLRQKSLIRDADIIITDFIGTHLGYCEYLNKEVIRIDSIFDTQFKVANKNDAYELKLSQSDFKKSQIDLIEKNMPLGEIAQSSKYKNIIEELWGFEYLK
jgi:hypothetical protein